MKLCSRLLIAFVEIAGKTTKLSIWTPFLGKLGVTHDLGWWLVGI